MLNIEEQIRLNFPLHLAKAYESARLESEPRLRVGKLVEFYEELLRYIALVGLASYSHYGLSTTAVEENRRQLNRPTMGTWLNLVRNVTKALRPRDRYFLSPPLGQKYEEGAIYEAVKAIRAMLGANPLAQVVLNEYLQALLSFRNEKIGHGSLAEVEARHLLPHLEGSLHQWLEGLVLLRERHLLYIDRVEYQGNRFSYTGMNLNAGATLYASNLEAGDAIEPRQVYWHLPSENRFIPLYPYFEFDRDIRLLYVFRHLTAQGKPELHCPYEPPSALSRRELPSEAAQTITAPPPETAPQPAPRPETPTPQPRPAKKDLLMTRNWFDIIQPHEDIRRGNFNEAIFAADIGDVAAGNAPDDYQDPYLFYKKTYLTAGLKGLLQKAHDKLAEGRGASVIQIKTPFGGGKTHALVALYHYLKNGEQIQSLLPAGLDVLRPRPKISVINGEHFNPVEGRTTNGLTRHTFWGEVAYQIGGAAGYEQFRANDEARVSPGKEKLRDFLVAHQPFILLFDEILEYVNRALDVSTRTATDVSLGTQTFSFFQELTDTVSSLPNGMLVVTLPASQLEDFGDAEEASLARMSKIFGRVESIETPVEGQEVYAVIRRRLFEVESLKQAAMQEVIHQYFHKYQENRDDLPPKARDVNYREKMALAYPFHPDVIDILYEKWSTYSSFQRTRGVLRLLANVVEDLYQRETNIDLILPGDINLERPGIRQDFLKHTGNEYEGVIASDIAGHEAKAQALDEANRPWKHLSQRIATAIFFHSFSADDSEKGINLPYIKLAVLRPGTFPALVTEVLQRQANLLWYLNSRGDNYYFSKIPNLNRMIMDKKELYNDSYEEELRHIVEREAGSRFRVYVWPETGDGIADNRELKLVILRPEDRGENIPAWTERKGQSFREYKNTLFFAVAEVAAFHRLREDVKTYLALKEIAAEVQHDANSPLAAKRAEIESRMHKIERDFSFNVRRMYPVLYAGTRRIDLGQPVAGRESLSHWYWRELTGSNVGAIVENLHYSTILMRLLQDNEQVATGTILEQFYKNTQLPVPAEQEVVARAIQLGIQDGVFGLAMAGDGPVTAEYLRFRETVPVNVIAFEPGFYLVSRARCEALLAEKAQREQESQLQAETSVPAGSEQGVVTPAEFYTAQTQFPMTTDEEVSSQAGQQPALYKRVRLVVSDIPASRIADVNRGIFLPLSAAVKELKFTLEIDVTSEEGISPATLEHKIKETIRQIGASLDEEVVE